MKTMMTLGLGIALAAVLSTQAYAQSKGEFDPATQGTAATAKKATPEEKAAAKAKRNAEGAAAAKTDLPGAVPGTTAVAKAASDKEKKEAAAKRKAAATESVKKKEIASGEK